MAKLHNYHVLCPLIDQKSFLGISVDKEAEDNVIVTLGRNVVNKYRLSDQKQVSGWTSRDHITAPVVYDQTQDNYVGVFNNNTIKIWEDNSTNLEKLKKYKFPINILKVIPRKAKPPLIVFTNGNTASLPYAIDNRKTYESKSLLRDTDEIVEISSCTFNGADHITYIVRHGADFEIVSCTLREELGDLDKSNFNREKIMRSDNSQVVGKLLYKQNVYILWSDAKIMMYNISTKAWQAIGTVPWISTQTAVSIAKMGQNHLILFGSNKNQEGAIIVAYNYILCLGSCRYPMKMYREDAQLYCFNSRIVLESSNHIGILPFTIETKRNLSSLLGSHEILEDERPEVVDWNMKAYCKSEFTTLQQHAMNRGITERKACAQIIPKLMEQGKFSKLIALIEEFKDIPESAIGALLKYTIKQLNHESLDITQPGFAEIIANMNEKKLTLLNSILNVTFCDALVIPYVREALTIDESVFLLWYVSNKLFCSFEELDNNYETKLCDWCVLLMDAFYQQYLISKDDKVSTVLNDLMQHVERQINCLYKVDNIMATLHNLKTSMSKMGNDEYLPYTIEVMKI